ncbi:hypothetical protein AAES_34469 [Amazona aestiva]|uniref:CCDC81 HU domain-containing protein n=1 Tax=Amazona aestiva TaxID=12930 RepID=A0A0Q3NS02_AMAAE|nr:hypothetical protein AAES_34469 [Amazona aestiva]
MQKIKSSEFARIWASASYYLSQRLALHQVGPTSSSPPILMKDVHIPGLGTFAVVREQVVSKQKDWVVVVRPVFHLANAIMQDHGLRYSHTDILGHRRVEQLPCAQIASDNGVSESTVRLYMERTIHLFQICLENRKKAALVWGDVGMVIIQGKDVRTKFYTDFLQRLNGTGKMLQALLEMPEMRDSVILSRDTAASQTPSGHVIVLPWYKPETMLKMPRVKADLRGHVNATQEGRGKAYSSGQKEDLAEKHLLHREKLSPNRLSARTVKSEQAWKAEGSEPPARQLPAIQGTILKEEEEKGKLFPASEIRTVDFIARAIEKREEDENWEQNLPKHIQKYMAEEEKKETEPREEKKRKRRSSAAIKAKTESKMEAPRSQESSCSKQPPVVSLTGWEMEKSSINFLEVMVEDWEDAREEPPTVPEEDPVPPKRSFSPRTHQALREVVTCILRQVNRKSRGQRDEQADLHDKLKWTGKVVTVEEAEEKQT